MAKIELKRLTLTERLQRGCWPLASVALVGTLALSGGALAGCSPTVAGSAGSTTAAASSEAAGTYTPGTYSGTGMDKVGDITVAVTFSEDAIEDIAIESENESATVAAGAYDILIEGVLENQTAGIDTVTGATLTSMGFLAAVQDAAKQAGASQSDITRPVQKELSTETIEMTTDTVVVGGGGAGIAASLRLSELGQNVVLVEKTYRLGGSLSVSGGNQVVQGSQLQKDCGVTDDSPESMIEDFQKNGEDMCVPELITLLSENIGPTTDWLNQEIGVEYDTESGLHVLGEYSHNRELAYAGGGAGATETFRAAIADSGTEVLTCTKGEELIVEDGAVRGVKAVAEDGTTYIIHANAVILATGGYGNSDE